MPVLLCLYDAPLPPPLPDLPARDVIFAAAFILLPERPDACLGALDVTYAAEAATFADAAPRDPSLAALAMNNPAAMSLRLLESLAMEQTDRFALPMLDGRVTVEVSPCR
jgi:hypothetical protein